MYSRLTNQNTRKKVNITFNDYFAILHINISLYVSRLINKLNRFKMITRENMKRFSYTGKTCLMSKTT